MFERLKDCHRITLLGDDVLNGCRDVLRFPEPSRAAMARPSLPARFVQTQAIQTTAGVGFEVAHAFWRNLRFHYRMHVTSPYMGRQQTPATMRARLLNCSQNGIATHLVQTIGSLTHAFPLGYEACGIHFQNGRSGRIMPAIHRTGLITVQVAPIAAKGDQANMAWIYLFAKEYERASEQAQKTLELFPGSLMAFTALGLTELSRRRYAQAIAALEKAAAISPDALTMAYLGAAQATRGRADIARSLVEDLLLRSERGHVPPRCFVFLYGAIGEPDRAFEWLAKAYEARDTSLFWLRVMPLYDPLRLDPRFDEMLRRLGLPRK